MGACDVYPPETCASIEQFGARAALFRWRRVVADAGTATGDSAGDDDDTGDSPAVDPGAGNAHSTISATRSRDAASRARAPSVAPHPASHGGSTETAAGAAHRARRSRYDGDTIAATTR